MSLDSHSKAAATNGRIPVDGRTRAGRRFRDLVSDFSRGVDVSTERARQRVKLAASLSLEIEGIENAAAAGEAIDRAELIRLGELQLKTLRDLESTP